MIWADNNPNVMEWASEELAIPYLSPIDNTWHRYFPDFRIVVQQKDRTQTFLIEIKPYKQTKQPEIPKRKTKQYIMEVMEYGRNSAKWKACNEYCEERKWQFKIVTEKELNIWAPKPS